MYGPGSSKKMESVGLIGSCLPKRAHTTGKKGRCRHSPVSSLKYHCLPMVHSNTVAPFSFENFCLCMSVDTPRMSSTVSFTFFLICCVDNRLTHPTLRVGRLGPARNVIISTRGRGDRDDFGKERKRERTEEVCKMNRPLDECAHHTAWQASASPFYFFFSVKG